MNNEIYNKENLPLKDLEKIGLATKNNILINPDDLHALLSGRRTGMIKIHNLSAENIHIKELDAKLSLRSIGQGKLELLLHPIYKEAIHPEYLSKVEADQLEKGAAANVLKTLEDENGRYKDFIIEFDQDTKEFIVTDTEKIRIPDLVNNIPLTELQKEEFRQGKVVPLDDGTSFTYTGIDRQDLRSNKIALVISILIDGGLSYLVYQGIMALHGLKQNNADSNKLSEGYYKSLKDASEKQEQKAGLSAGYGNKNEQSRGYGRSGISR